MRDYYVREIRFRKFIVLFGVLPIFMLTLSPLILWQGSKNYLKDRRLTAFAEETA